MTDTPRCDRCRKQLAADKKLCSTCETIGTCIDIGPAALAAILDGGDGTCQDAADGGGD